MIRGRLVESIFKIWLDTQEMYPRRSAEFWQAVTAARIRSFSKKLNWVDETIIQQALMIEGDRPRL